MKRGRPYCRLTRLFISVGLTPKEAMKEANRARARASKKPYDPAVNTPARRKYNRQWMAEYRAGKR